MKEQDVKDFIGKAFRFEIVKSMKLKTNHTCWPGIPYYEVKFEDSSTEIQIYETSATWFKVSGLDEDIVSYSSEWRIFSFERMLKRNEVNEESFEKKAQLKQKWTIGYILILMMRLVGILKNLWQWINTILII